MLKPSLLGLVIASATIAGNIIEANARTVPLVAPTTAPKAPQIISRASESITEIEREIFNQINQYRASKGLSALVWNEDMARQARQHSQNMATRKIPFGHSGFDGRAKDLIKSVGYRSIAENTAYMTTRQNLATKATRAWLTSSKHLHNIEGQFHLTGIGVSRSPDGGYYYFTEMFVQK